MRQVTIELSDATILKAEQAAIQQNLKLEDYIAQSVEQLLTHSEEFRTQLKRVINEDRELLKRLA